MLCDGGAGGVFHSRSRSKRISEVEEMTTEGQSLNSSQGIRLGPRASYAAVVTSFPFEALYEAALARNGQRQKVAGAIFRDSKGRVRRECHIDYNKREEASGLIIITDLINRNTVVLDGVRNLAINFTDLGPQPGQSLLRGWAFEGSWSLVDGTERRMVEGLIGS